MPNKLRAYRSRRGITIAALARAAGLPYSTVSMIDHGKRDNPSMTIVLALSAALRADPRRLFPDPVVQRRSGLDT